MPGNVCGSMSHVLNDTQRNNLKTVGLMSLLVLITLIITNMLDPTSSIHSEIGELKSSIQQLTNIILSSDRKREKLQRDVEKINEKVPEMYNDLKNMSFGSSIEDDRAFKLSKNYDAEIPDFALESAGGKIVSTGDTKDYILFESLLSRILTRSINFVIGISSGARAMIQPGAFPGECWAFEGAKSEAVILLVGPVFVSGVSVKHVTQSVSPSKDISSAPRQLQFSGLENLKDKGVDLGRFEYMREGEPDQYFAVRLATRAFSYVRVRVLANWGNPRYTCVYRVRVHGKLATGSRGNS